MLLIEYKNGAGARHVGILEHEPVRESTRYSER